MTNQYDVLYHLLRKRIVDGAAYPVNKSEFWLKVLDTHYSERKPFPLEIAIIFGDPFAPPGFEGLKIKESWKRIKPSKPGGKEQTND
jgi:hypothetical protein